MIMCVYVSKVHTDRSAWRVEGRTWEWVDGEEIRGGPQDC